MGKVILGVLLMTALILSFQYEQGAGLAGEWVSTVEGVSETIVVERAGAGYRATSSASGEGRFFDMEAFLVAETQKLLVWDGESNRALEFIRR